MLLNIFLDVPNFGLIKDIMPATQYAIAPMVGAALIGAGAQIVGGLFGASSAKKAARKAAAEAKRRAKELEFLESTRQAIINPYEGIKDVSSMMSNPYASLGVATQAAEFQAEQADISLANTLDTLQQTGAGAGGATALAQAALQSKKQISASIEQQEANNEQLRAQGEQKLQEIKMAEAQRIQSAEAQGKAFMFGTREEREIAKMNRVAGQQDTAQARLMQANADRTGAITGMVGGLSSIASSFMSAAGRAGEDDDEDGEGSGNESGRIAGSGGVSERDMSVDEMIANQYSNPAPGSKI